jgi:hypothetical protein
MAPACGQLLPKNPITGIVACCARATTDHAAAPPSSVVGWIVPDERICGTIGAMPDVTIESDGRTFSASFNVLGKTITVSSASLGTKTAVLRNLPTLQEFAKSDRPSG